MEVSLVIFTFMGLEVSSLPLGQFLDWPPPLSSSHCYYSGLTFFDGRSIRCPFFSMDIAGRLTQINQEILCIDNEKQEREKKRLLAKSSLSRLRGP
ncbi:conserved hypothetical protein [Ricinus communis]|uniref:Uncharacterized protein n=1 Tax=Ricinus communis TaxID=3988 RepID=B9SQ80_RICCO|nr:conserved hypothetical protein [Ricinus communis]